MTDSRSPAQRRAEFIVSQITDEISVMMADAYDEVRHNVIEALVQAQERQEKAVLAERERCATVIQGYIDQWTGTSAEQVFKEMQARIRSGE